MGPPPFVQSLIASKGMPFGGMGMGAAAGPEEAPAALGPPAYVQSLIASKAGPFAAFAKPLGPPAWVQEFINEKNAAAEAEAQALAEQQAAAAAAAAGPPTDPAVAGLPPFIQELIDAKAAAAGPFAPLVSGGAATKTAPPPAWIMDMINAQIASKAAKAGPFGVGPSAPPGPQPSWGTPAKRDVGDASAPATQASPAPQPMTLAAFNPFFGPYGPMQMAAPPAPLAAAPNSPAPAMMPMPIYPGMLPPFMPYWKMMG